MKNKYSKGDLVYIPQAVSLFTYKGPERFYSTNMRLKIPRNCLVVDIDEENQFASVLYDGETWFVKLADIYPATRDEGEKASV